MNVTIEWTQRGQIRPYADAIYSGFIVAQWKDAPPAKSLIIHELRKLVPVVFEEIPKHWSVAILEELSLIKSDSRSVVWKFRIRDQFKD